MINYIVIQVSQMIAGDNSLEESPSSIGQGAG